MAKLRLLLVPLVVAAAVLSAPVAASAAELITNGGFESGALSPWTCSLGSVVTSPVHTGGYAVQGAVSTADNAQCTQTVAVLPNTAYTLTGWVRGNYVYLGVTGGASTWTPAAASYTQLTVAFTTGASQTSAQIYTHGWYAQGSYDADDISLSGPGGGSGVPGVPGTPVVGTVTSSSVALSWAASSGTVTGYRVYEGSTVVSAPGGPSATITGLATCSTHTWTVSAYNSVGESAKSAPVSATTGGCPSTGLPKHALIGYLHASFANGSGYLKLSDVPAAWDIIDLAFGEPTSVTSGDIRFTPCPPTSCPGAESDAQFKADIQAKRAAGKKVLLSIGGQNGEVQLTTTAARDTFVSSVSSIIDTYGLDGLDVDFEGHSLYLNSGDTDFRNPTTPVIVNLISALRTLKNRYGASFVLTMAPETFFVQLGYQFYGGTCASCDQRAGSFLPVIYALRDALTVLHVQDYNSGPITGLDNQYHTMGGADFHIAMTDMVAAGFPVANTGLTFPALREDQIGFGTPSESSAGNGYVTPAVVEQALDCLVKGVNCGGYTLRGGTDPNLRGVMTWSINWDHYYGYDFQNNLKPYLNSLP